MKAQAQFTIHSLNDVIASTTAPSSPYKGQLWVNTSYSPPRTFVYNGSAWKEQNGTDTLRSNISTLTTKSNTMQSNLDGLTSTVSAVTTRVETVENDLGTVEENILDIQTDVSELEQTASSIALRVSANESDISSLTMTASGLTTRVSSAEGNISTLQTSVSGLTSRVSTAEGDISSLEQTTSSLSATVATKVNAEGGSTSSFGWKLTSSGFYLYASSATVMSVTSSGLSVSGSITATSGTIGGFTIGSSSIYKTKTSYSSSTAGVYLGTNGIGLGAGTFYVTSAGYLYATNANITGTINATSGYFSEVTITGYIYFNEDQQYFLNPNYDNGSWYIYLPKFRVDDTSAYFEGTLSAPSGNIGGFTIGSSSIYKTKTAYSNTTAGVYLGTDGIGLGAGTFYVTSAGTLTATSATITGAITATSGSVQNMTVKGRLYFGNNSSYYIDANYNDSSYYIYLPGFRVDDASGAVFSGKLSAASGSFSGTITATGGKIGSLSITDGGLLYGSVSGNTATGVKINTTTIWAKYSYFTSGSIGCWGYSSSGMSASYSSYAGFNGNDSVYIYPETLRYRLYGTSSYPSVRWQTVVDIINTASSDKRIKKNIEPLSDAYDLLFDALIAKRYKYIDGTSKRYHTGFVAQEVVEAIEKAGLSLSDFAAVMLECPGSEKETWKLRRDEFVALNTWQIQKLKKRIVELEAKLDAKEG